MSRFLACALGVAVLLGALSSLALAGQPDPLTSTWDELVGVSPKNVTATVKYVFTGTIRDGAGIPIDNFPASQLELDFTNCIESSTRPFNQVPADQDSFAGGQVVWTLNLDFGGADPCEVNVLVQNVVFKTLAGHQALSTGCPENPPAIDGGLRSVDAQGDGVIGLQDLGALQTEFFNCQGATRNDYIGDMAPVGGPPGTGFDGITGLSDLGQLQDHFFAPGP
jgi:hypothetical protein